MHGIKLNVDFNNSHNSLHLCGMLNLQVTFNPLYHLISGASSLQREAGLDLLHKGDNSPSPTTTVWTKPELDPDLMTWSEDI